MFVMMRLFPAVVICSAAFLSCLSHETLQNQEAAVLTESGFRIPVPAKPVPEPPSQPEPAAGKADFDYAHITEEVQNITRIDVRQLIEKLNEIIRSGNYRAWVENLDESYLARINSREFLDGISQTPRFKSREDPLKDAEDYFFNVVIPSRINENDQIDEIDIEFVPEEKKIFAFRILSNGQRRRLYELKNIKGTWKIIN